MINVNNFNDNQLISHLYKKKKKKKKKKKHPEKIILK